MSNIINNTLIESQTRVGYIFISDIHGTKQTINLIEYARNDYPKFILVGGGDYIDGHKNSKIVLDYLMKQQNSVILRGNHEQMLIDFANGKDDFIYGYNNEIEPLWWANGGKTTLYSLFHKRFNKRNNQLAKKLLKESEYYRWLNTLPIMYETPNAIFVHGGIHLDKQYDNPAYYPSVTDPNDDNYDTYRLWAREEYWWHKGVIKDQDTGIPAKWLTGQMGYFAHNQTGKTIVTGHTPTALICGCYDDWSIKNKHCILQNKFTRCNVLKIQYPNEPARIFTDGGCHSQYQNHWGNVVVLDKNGKILKIYNYQNPDGVKYENY